MEIKLPTTKAAVLSWFDSQDPTARFDPEEPCQCFVSEMLRDLGASDPTVWPQEYRLNYADNYRPMPPILTLAQLTWMEAAQSAASGLLSIAEARAIMQNLGVGGWLCAVYTLSVYYRQLDQLRAECATRCTIGHQRATIVSG